MALSLSARARFAATVAATLLVTACNRHQSEAESRTTASATPVASASASNSSPSAVASAPSNAKRVAPRASAGATVELTEAEKEADIRYHAALERGRRATTAKDYDAASKAFTEALTAKPNDARALGERGFAAMQSGNIDNAEGDFEQADGRTQDPTLAAQIFFNEGLLAERKGDLESAKVSYARSLQTHPTGAAKAKVEQLHASTCTAAFVPLNRALDHYANWVELWNRLGMMDKKTTEQDVKDTLLSGPCDDACVVNDGELWYVVIPAASGLDVLAAVDHGVMDRCASFPKFEFSRQGSILTVSSTNEDMQVGLCDPKCDNDKQNGQCPLCCDDGPGHRYDTFIDVDAKRALLRVAQYSPHGESFQALPVTLDAQNSVHVSGGSCDKTVPLPSK